MMAHHTPVDAVLRSGEEIFPRTYWSKALRELAPELLHELFQSTPANHRREPKPRLGGVC